MAEMKTLTVNGVTYTVADPDAAHIDDAVVGESAWSGKNIIDRLCPAFTVSGRAVRCAPVEGYPLEVVTALPQSEAGYSRIELRQLGKNLYDKDSYPLTAHYIMWSSGNVMTSKSFLATVGYIPVSGLAGVSVTLNHCPNDKAPGTNAGMAFYDADKVYISGTNDATMTVPENAAYMRFSVPNEHAAGEIQIELGQTVTAYEPYHSGVTVVAELEEPVFDSYRWEALPALPGTNTLYSDVGQTTVTGRKDLIAILQPLTGD